MVTHPTCPPRFIRIRPQLFQIHDMANSMRTDLLIGVFGYSSHTHCWQVIQMKHTAMECPHTQTLAGEWAVRRKDPLSQVAMHSIGQERQFMFTEDEVMDKRTSERADSCKRPGTSIYTLCVITSQIQTDRNTLNVPITPNTHKTYQRSN